MNKTSYLAQADVRDFIDWFACHLSPHSRLGHHYVKPGKKQVEFGNLADALAKYDWPFSVTWPDGTATAGSTFHDNKAVLASLKTQLGAAIDSEDDARVCAAAVAVMQWGGVTAGNALWLRRNQVGLAKLIAGVAATLTQENDEHAAFTPDLRFNAGMTKVYSLLLDNFIIYDSRVAAALAWFVMVWILDNGRASIPEELNFPCMPAKEGFNPEVRKIRNPGVGKLAFQKMNNRPLLHAQSNLRASWLIEAALKEARDKDRLDAQFQAEGVRGVEAALFMWGYDLGRNSRWMGAQEYIAMQDDDGTAEQLLVDAPVSLSPLAQNVGVTHGHKQLPFTWHFDEANDRLVIQRNERLMDEFSLVGVFSVLHALHDRFGDDTIPLANNVVKLGLAGDPVQRNNLNYDGLGMAIMDLPNSTVMLGQAASYLGPILDMLGQFRWNGRRTGIGYSFNAMPPASLGQLRDLLSEYAG